MKKFVSFLLTTVIVFTTLFGFGTISFAEAFEDARIRAELDEGEVCFDTSYAEAGKKMSVSVGGYNNDDLIFKWYIDNEQINNYSDSYTPDELDYEKMITVKVYDKSCELVGKKSMFISKLPVVYVEVENRNDIVSKTKYVNAEINIQGNSEYNDSSILYSGTTEIKGRGNSTWLADKRPYKLKLSSKANLFGMGKNKHWVLLSNPYETSNMRNELSYHLSEDFGLNRMQSVWVELVLNGEPEGLYQLCEHIRIGDTRVDITNWDDIAEDAAKAIYKKNTNIMTKDERDELIEIMTDDMNWVTSDTVTYQGNTFTVSDYYSVPDITGGYLLEVDCYEDSLNFRTPSGINIAVSKPEGIGTDMFNYIEDYYTAFETALFSDDYCTEYNGKTMRYTDFIDIESFATGILINEIFENFDFGFNSTWMSKEIDEKIVYGPVWDMDYTTASSFISWTTSKRDWIKRMLSDPVMMSKMRDIYFAHRYTDIVDMLKSGGDIDEYTEKIYTSAVYNDNLWDNSLKFEDNVNDLRWRLQTKIGWLDTQLFSLDSALKSVKASGNFVNSDSLSLSIADDILTVTSSNSDADLMKIFSDGVLIETVTDPDSIENIRFPSANNGETITVIEYSGGTPVCGSYLETEKYVKKLEVVKKPDKMLYSSGEAIDLTGLELLATYSDSSTETVMPEAVYSYTTDSLGTQYFCYGSITDKVGSKALSLMYKNTKVNMYINSQPTENYTEVAKKIAAIPADGEGMRYIKNLFDAKTSYDALSDTAKAEVKNNIWLTKCWDNFKNTAEESNIACMGFYPDGVVRTDAKNNLVVIVKNSPRAIIFTIEPYGTTTTLTRDSSTIISIKKVEDFEVWTVNISMNSNMDHLKIRVWYSKSDTNSYEQPCMYISDAVNFGKDIVRVSFKDSAYVNESFKVKIQTLDTVQAVRLSENGKAIGVNLTDTQTHKELLFAFDTVGVHEVTLSFLIDGVWVTNAVYTVKVRQKPETDSKIFFVNYSDADFRSTTKLTVTAECDVPMPTLISGDASIEFTSEEKNGFRIWSCDMPTGDTNTLLLNGEIIMQDIFSRLLGDVNNDGKRNSFDALLVLMSSVGQRQLSPDEAMRADMNMDGIINSFDALIILKISTGNI